jgi:acetyl esterase
VAPQRARAAYDLAAEILDLPRVPLPRVQNLVVPRADGSTGPARLYAPSHDAGLPVLLYLHGGGFVIGGLETHNSLCRQLAQRSGVAVLAAEYRKAPEHRFPAAVDDSVAAMRWLFENAGPLGLDATRIGVAGDSAGATLAAVCAHVARDEALPLAFQLLVTPGVAAAPDSDSHRRFSRGFLLDADTIQWFFSHYIDPMQRLDWRFAPIQAPDFEGLAPTLVLLAECDPLVDEGLAYADRLRAAGVEVGLELVRGVTHDFIKMGRALEEARHALAVAGTALRRAFEP